MVRGIGEDEPLSVARDGAELAHALATSVEYGSLQDVLDVESRRQVAVLVAHLAVLAAGKQQATYCDQYMIV